MIRHIMKILSLCIFLTIILPSCNNSAQTSTDEASEKITRTDVLARLQENNLQFAEMELENGASVIIVERGGRILGPFIPDSGKSLLWINPAFAHVDSFRKSLEDGNISMGGERVWIAPEIQYHVKDRQDFWSTLEFPTAVDPGNYELNSKMNEIILKQRVSLTAYNLANGEKSLSLHRSIRPVKNPIRHINAIDELMEKVLFTGYEHIITIEEDQRNDIVSETWDLIQVQPTGYMLIPCSPALEYSDYFEPMPQRFKTMKEDHARFKITGNRQYKIGLKAAHVLGRPAYFKRLGGGNASVVICNFFNNPSAYYAEEPAESVGNRGHSVHIYNDDGMFGGFGELECNGQTIGGNSGRSRSSDQLVFWFFTGKEEKIRQIILHLLGINM